MYRLEKENQYKDESLGISCGIPKGWEAQLVETPQVQAIDAEEKIESAIKNPKYGEALREIAKRKKAKTACILVSDATRAVPTARLLKYVVEELCDGGLALENIHVFVAIGVHRDATLGEMQTFLGEYHGKISIENHTPFDKDKLQYLGSTSGGTPIWVNKKAWECDLHIQIGKVEPHEFAGFSGGRKSVLPGIAGEETIIVNHRPDMILNKKSAIGVLEGNPVHCDMEETAEKFGIDFGVNCILNNQLELSAVFAGEMKICHRAAIDWVRTRLGVDVKRPDVLVTTPGQPLDIDFYQTLKALIALTEVLDKDTIAILYCGCPEGVNSVDMLQAFASSDQLEEAISYTVENYKIQMDHTLLVGKILRKNVRILVCCSNISDEDVEKMFMTPCHSLEEALEKAREISGKENGKILFYPRPQTGLPVLKD